MVGTDKRKINTLILLGKLETLKDVLEGMREIKDIAAEFGIPEKDIFE